MPPQVLGNSPDLASSCNMFPCLESGVGSFPQAVAFYSWESDLQEMSDRFAKVTSVRSSARGMICQEQTVHIEEVERSFHDAVRFHILPPLRPSSCWKEYLSRHLA